MNRELSFLGATIIPCNGDPPIEDAIILTRDGRIEAVGGREDVAVPLRAEKIDCFGDSIIPGLIDAHVHFFQSGGLYTRPDIVDLRYIRSYREECRWIRRHINDTLRRYLAAGVTSVVDNGGPFWNFSVRARALETDAAPRVAAAGPLISSVERHELDWDGDLPIVCVRSSEHARQMVCEQAEACANFIKIWWVVTPDVSNDNFQRIVEATVRESHGRGLRVMAHAQELETARAAVNAGVDILVHSVLEEIDENFIELLHRRGTICCPTLSVLEGYAQTLALKPTVRSLDLLLAHPEVVETLLSVVDIPDFPHAVVSRISSRNTDELLWHQANNLRRLHKAGVRIAAGTDAGNIGTLHGSSMLRELQLMRQSGLSTAAVLEAATRGGATLMGKESAIGTLERGKFADFVVLRDDPLQNIANVASVRYVVKGGQLFTPSRLVVDRPQDVVQRQLNAYNAHNIDIFMSCYANDAKVCVRRAGGDLTLMGIDEIRSQYALLFEKAPCVHASVRRRSIGNSTIVDREHVVGFSQNAEIEADVRYFVQDGLIKEVTIVDGR